MAALSDDPSPSNPKPRPKSHTSPPFADNVVRPFTSQGSSSRTPLQLLTYGYPQRHYDDRPASADGSRIDTNAKFGPYVSASARTSYTRVDVDALSSPIYPVLSPPHSATFPTATGAANLPDASAPAAARAATPTPSTPASDVQPSISEPPIPQTPQVSLTFLLVTGLRKTQSFDPETTVGRVKELVWNAWPARDADWQDERPPAPSYLRILYLGKILQDDDTLLHIGFPTSLPSANTAPTIVHLSIRPYALPSDDPALSKKKRLSVAIGRRFSTMNVGVVGNGRDAERDADAEVRRAGCCNCVIC